jgi:hypothetical protein
MSTPLDGVVHLVQAAPQDVEAVLQPMEPVGDEADAQVGDRRAPEPKAGQVQQPVAGQPLGRQPERRGDIDRREQEEEGGPHHEPPAHLGEGPAAAHAVSQIFCAPEQDEGHRNGQAQQVFEFHRRRSHLAWRKYGGAGKSDAQAAERCSSAACSVEG